MTGAAAMDTDEVFFGIVCRSGRGWIGTVTDVCSDELEMYRKTYGKHVIGEFFTENEAFDAMRECIVAKCDQMNARRRARRGKANWIVKDCST
jgi:hypothetical protein